MDSILQLLHRMQQEKVEFVLIGGLAAVLHGSSVVTQDIDICMPFTRQNLEALLRVLHDLDPCFRMNLQRQPLPMDVNELERFHNLYLTTKYGFLDVLGMVDGI